MRPILHFHPECTGSIRTDKVSAITQFTFTAIWHQVKWFNFQLKKKYDLINYLSIKTGSTSILHDSESSVNVGHCADAGCYSRSINYNSSIGQIKALMELSTECHQSIRVSFIWSVEFLAFKFLILLLVRLQLCPIRVIWHRLFLVERQRRNSAILLGRK